MLQVHRSDGGGGGAERIAWNLFQIYRERGCDSYLAVGRKYTQNPDALLIPNNRARAFPARILNPLADRLLDVGGACHGWAGLLGALIRGVAAPAWFREWIQGVEDFDYPGTRQVLGLPPGKPDILHGHNLHRRYFDLRELPALTAQVPTVLTLHDAWLLSGHCAHSFDCERWKAGCGQCPDLTIYPEVRRDATARNWERKKRIYAKSRLYIATPCSWLMEKVRQSMLAPALAGARVIPNGVDLSVFKPMDQAPARAELRIEPGATVLLFAANSIRKSIWKDYSTLRQAIARVAESRDRNELTVIALGEKAPVERVGHAEIRFVPYQSDPRRVARFFQAADLYVHATRADTFPNTILEAMACGLPVIATAIGGIPEQVKGLQNISTTSPVAELNRYPEDEATGLLVPPRDPTTLSDGIRKLAEDGPLRRRLAANAVRNARERFGLARQADDYLAWYQEILDR